MRNIQIKQIMMVSAFAIILSVFVLKPNLITMQTSPNSNVDTLGAPLMTENVTSMNTITYTYDFLVSALSDETLFPWDSISWKDNSNWNLWRTVKEQVVEYFSQKKEDESSAQLSDDDIHDVVNTIQGLSIRGYFDLYNENGIEREDMLDFIVVHMLPILRVENTVNLRTLRLKMVQFLYAVMEIKQSKKLFTNSLISWISLKSTVTNEYFQDYSNSYIPFMFIMFKRYLARVDVETINSENIEEKIIQVLDMLFEELEEFEDRSDFDTAHQEVAEDISLHRKTPVSMELLQMTKDLRNAKDFICDEEVKERLLSAGTFAVPYFSYVCTNGYSLKAKGISVEMLSKLIQELDETEIETLKLKNILLVLEDALLHQSVDIRNDVVEALIHLLPHTENAQRILRLGLIDKNRIIRSRVQDVLNVDPEYPRSFSPKNFSSVHSPLKPLSSFNASGSIKAEMAQTVGVMQAM